MTWNPEHKLGKGTPLEKIEIRSGSWEFSTIYRDCLVAHEWNMIPTEFWELTAEEQSIMIAFIEAKNTMENHEITLKKDTL